MSLLGIDFGTDSVRALIVDEAGQTLAEAVRPYPRWGEGRYIDAAAGMFRQHPLDYIEAMTDAVREAVSHVDASDVKGIGVDTTGSTPCLTDATGTPLAGPRYGVLGKGIFSLVYTVAHRFWPNILFVLLDEVGILSHPFL